MTTTPSSPSRSSPQFSTGAGFLLSLFRRQLARGRLAAAQSTFNQATENRNTLEDLRVPLPQYFHNYVHEYAKRGLVEETKRGMEALKDMGVDMDFYYYNTVILGLVKRGELGEAEKVMRERLAAPDTLTFNLLMDGWLKRGNRREVWRFFEEMKQRGLQIDEFTINILLESILRDRSIPSSKERVDQVKSTRNRLLEEHSVKPSTIMFNILMTEFNKLEQYSETLQLHEEMKSRKIKSSESTTGECTQRLLSSLILLFSVSHRNAFDGNVIVGTI